MNPVSIKLDEANFSTWKKEALEEIQARKVEKFTTEAPETKDGGRPRMFRSARDENLQKINTEYRKWDQQDQVVYRWLLASISPELGTRMVGCQRAFQIWKKIEAFCLQVSPPRISRKSCSSNEYFLLIKKIVGMLHDTANDQHRFILW
uniref:Retrovirus-related Pol polyprotein from transposon TNT 1-94 n=1 Tax=Cajanus cajan TaxID=3821 RepID=A0A151TK25_CAJCA|nr:hypothetical protein KK1_013674 [Cajanus cajan]